MRHCSSLSVPLPASLLCTLTTLSLARALCSLASHPPLVGVRLSQLTRRRSLQRATARHRPVQHSGERLFILLQCALQHGRRKSQHRSVLAHVPCPAPHCCMRPCSVHRLFKLQVLAYYYHNDKPRPLCAHVVCSLCPGSLHRATRTTLADTVPCQCLRILPQRVLQYAQHRFVQPQVPCPTRPLHAWPHPALQPTPTLQTPRYARIPHRVCASLYVTTLYIPLPWSLSVCNASR